MFFIKYAPVNYRRILTSIYLLFWFAVILLWVVGPLNLIARTFNVDYVYVTLTLVGVYFGINLIFTYGFKPIVKKNNKPYITPYIIDLFLLVILFFYLTVV